MSQTIVSRTINAPVGLVFKTVADITQYSKANPHIVKVEFLSDIKSGVGARFRETRLMRGKEISTELEVTEYIENEGVRIISDTHGTIWDSNFVVKSENGYTLLTMTMDARTKNVFNKIINFLISGMLKKAVEKDIDGVKTFCEK